MNVNARAQILRQIRVRRSCNNSLTELSSQLLHIKRHNLSRVPVQRALTYVLQRRGIVRGRDG